MLLGGPSTLEGPGLSVQRTKPSSCQMRKLRPGEGWPQRLSRSPGGFGGRGQAATGSGHVCGGWTEARQRREAAVTRGRGRFWLGARMGPPPAPPG